jgi:lipopolysaccharide transport system permease protein
MYGTTVIYPLSSAPEKYKYLIEINPMTFIIETFRYGFLGKGAYTMEGFIYSSTVTIVVFILGLVIFNKTEKNFVDTI